MDQLFQPEWKHCGDETYLVAKPGQLSAEQMVNYAMQALANNDYRSAKAPIAAEWYPDWGLRVLFFLCSPDMRRQTSWVGDYDVFRNDIPDAWRWWFKHPASQLQALLNNKGQYKLSTIANGPQNRNDCMQRVIVQVADMTIAFDCVKVWSPFEQVYGYWRIANITPLSPVQS